MRTPISALKTSSEKVLLKKMSMEDLRFMAYLSSDVIKGNATVEHYRLQERAMISKYGFKVN